jgi:hypothetical protein
MNPQQHHLIETERYARCISASKSVRWDIDRDVIRDRTFDFLQKFLPDGISKIDRLDFLKDEEKRFLSQIQGRTYANMFGFVERFITAKILEISREHWLGDQIALEALVRFCDEELKHEELFRRIEEMMTEGMPAGYSFPHDPNAVAGAVLAKSTWAVMALILEIELFTQAHYKQSIAPDDNLSELYKDIFYFHWREECQHAILDELEWPRQDEKLTPEQREEAVNDLIELVVDVDGLLQAQAELDVEYFVKAAERPFSEAQKMQIKKAVLKAYRWQYIFSGTENPRFAKLLGSMITEDQGKRIHAALATLQ